MALRDTHDAATVMLHCRVAISQVMNLEFKTNSYITLLTYFLLGCGFSHKGLTDSLMPVFPTGPPCPHFLGG